MRDEDLLDKIRFLLRLGEDPRTPGHEAAAALLAAERRMREAGLTREELSAISDQRSAKSQEPRASYGVVVTDPLLILNDSYRVARLTPPLRYSSHIICIPKRYVKSLTLLEPEDVEAMGWKRCDRITRVVVLDRAYVDDSGRYGWRSWV